MSAKKKNSALLEIGVEELPARFIEPAIKQLKTLFSDALTSAGLSFSDIEVWGTPRRLAILINGLPTKAEDRDEVAIGPPPQAPQKAVEGFAKSQKVNPSKLIVEKTAKGERYVVHHAKKGIKTELALKEIFPSIIGKINFPKNMVWESTQFKFARPIRWLVALFNSKVIRFKLAGVTSDKNTVGLLSLGGKKFAISKPEKYKSLLQNRCCIIVDPKDRRKLIETQLENQTKKLKPAGRAITTEEHLTEVVHLTEFPTSIRGQFDEQYLKLPKEVTTVVLRKHQKFFPIETTQKKLTRYFIGVRNGATEHQDGVRDGYERVTRARLADAEFFYEQDLKTPLDDLIPKLDGIGFIPEMGNMLDKTKRVHENSKKIMARLKLNDVSRNLILTVADLAKTDLLTQMVGEFPELQGIMGRIYAHRHTDNQGLGNAIEQHYWPLTADGQLPHLEEAAVVSVADKIDNLATHFAVGHIPTGSQDPFGLRRSAMGVLRIISDRKWRFSIENIVDIAFSDLPSQYEKDKNAKKELNKFLKQRVLNYLKDKGYRIDEIEAVLVDQAQPLHVAIEKLKGLKSIRSRSEFVSLSAAIKRARNIIAQAEEKGIFNSKTSNGLATENLEEKEAQLFAAVNTAAPKVAEALKSEKYQNAFLALAPLKDPVDQFFEGVMVMVDDEQQRTMRLSLLVKVKNLFDTVADFSKIQPHSK